MVTLEFINLIHRSCQTIETLGSLLDNHNATSIYIRIIIDFDTRRTIMIPVGYIHLPAACIGILNNKA